MSTPGANSAFLCPINDALQTMPQITILIPFVMIFKVGEFTALAASVAVTIVPAIRDAGRLLRDVLVWIVAAACPGGART